MSAKNIANALNCKCLPYEIPDCGRDDLPEFFRMMGYKEGVEIGVYKGEFAQQLLASGLKMHEIDPWLAYHNYDTHHERHLIKRQKKITFQKRQDFLYEHTKRILDEYVKKGQCNIIRKTSMDALQDFEDESLDFVYIDGHHGFRYIAEDLYEWIKKVKVGGIVSGHDYATNKKKPRDPYAIHVRHVVDAFVKAYCIPNFYVLGRRKMIEGEIRDRWRSWFFVKQESLFPFKPEKCL